MKTAWVVAGSSAVSGLSDILTQPRDRNSAAGKDLRTRWQLSKAATLSAGVENLFDKYYADHLGGINRVSGGDVAVGAHLPGAGRFLYLAGEYGW